jgi:mono/diheme cytochrome c family protein
MRARHCAAVTAFSLLLIAAVSGCAFSGGVGQSDSPASAAQLGQQIFTTGNGADGSPLGVTSGAGGPCARCHGVDGTGAVGPDIRWGVLTGSEASSHPPRFPIADPKQFVDAVSGGSAAGNQLIPLMPRYQLTPAEAAALVAYLKTL